MWDVTSMGVRGLAPWSWSNFEITGCQISNCKHFRLKMWDFTTKGVRGLAPWSWSIFEIISCWDFTSIGVMGVAPWSWSIFKISHQISNFSIKNVGCYLNGGQGACPLKLKLFWNHRLSDKQLETFQAKNLWFYQNGGQGTSPKAFLKSQVGGILLQWGSWGLPPEAEAFWKVQVVR